MGSLALLTEPVELAEGANPAWKDLLPVPSRHIIGVSREASPAEILRVRRRVSK